MAADNKSLGRFQLTDIPPAPRGIPQIEVTFDIDANGIMHISAKDKGTGKEQSIKIEASSGLTDEEIQRMKRDAEANAESDKKRKEEVDTLNGADALIFQTEKQLKEFGDKIPADKKGAIESALADLKMAFEAKALSELKPKMEALTAAFQAASQDMYNASGDAGAASNDAGGDTSSADEVTDVDFEEVDEKK
jgi:molecular chaperone DnaK